MGLSHEPELPYASSLCGACAEVCPVKIDIPKILLELRNDVKKAQRREENGPFDTTAIERAAFVGWAWLMRHPRLFELAGSMAQLFLPPEGNGHWIRSLPGPLQAWTRWRDFPPPAPQSFRQLWRARGQSSREKPD
jgi:L-lactate dehydrogenase complex protein LldF